MEKITLDELKEIYPFRPITTIAEGVFRIEGDVRSREAREKLKAIGFKQYSPRSRAGLLYWTNNKDDDGIELNSREWEERVKQARLIAEQRHSQRPKKNMER